MKNRRTKKSGWIALGIFILLLAITPPLFLHTVRSYLSSDAFRTRAGEEISHALDADGAFAPFQWTGSSCFTQGFQATGKPSSYLERIKADNLRADFNLGAIWKRTWQIDSLSIGRLQAVFGSTTSPEPANYRDPFNPLHLASMNPFTALLPNKTKLLDTQVDQLDVYWRPTKNKTTSYTGGRLNIQPGNQGLKISGEGGILVHPEWPSLEVDSFRARYHRDQLFLEQAFLKPGSKGFIEVHGETTLEPTPTVELDVDFNTLPVDFFLNEDWRVRLQGHVQGHTDIRYCTGQDPHPRQEGDVELLDGTLKAMPILDQIATFTKTERFRLLVLNTAEAHYRYNNGRLYVSQINAESDGLVKVEGALAIEHGLVEGLLQVGVSPTTLQWIPGSQAKVFTAEQGGYRWTSVRLSGPVENPKEDLSERLLAAAGEAILDEVVENADAIGEQLKGVADEAIKALTPFFE